MPTSSLPERLWDVADAAAFLRVSRSWVYRAAESGLIPYRKVGNRLRFVPAEVETWVNSTASTPLPQRRA